MPEGHSLRRLALAFDRWFVGRTCDTSSPQGRFDAGAARLCGMRMTGADSVGKHLFLRFESDGSEGTSASGPLWLHVHLGLYGSWRFYGRPGIRVPASIGAPRLPDLATSGGDGVAVTSVNGEVSALAPYVVPEADTDVASAGSSQDAGEDAFTIVAAQGSSAPGPEEECEDSVWEPPPPRGAVRLRIVTKNAAADLTGPTRCEVVDAAGVEEVLGRLGPDPLDKTTAADALRREFISRVRASRRPIGELVMDQSVAAGVGNIYRAEALFRQGISPYRRGMNVSRPRLERLWDDLVVLLADGVTHGHIHTVDRSRVAEEVEAVDPEAQKWFVYKRAGKPCLVCGTPVRTKVMQGRNLFWCSTCQR